jgi:hypothetical protein
MLQDATQNDEVKLDMENTNVGVSQIRARALDEDVCGILVHMNGEEGAVILVESLESLNSKPLIIRTGPDKTGYELILIKKGQRATISHGASGRCIRQ